MSCEMAKVMTRPGDMRLGRRTWQDFTAAWGTPDRRQPGHRAHERDHQIRRLETALGAGKAARRRRYGICPMWQQRAYGESGTWRRSLVRLSPGRSSYKRDLTWTRRETFRANPRRNG
jgi:hypothetical protein